MIILNTEPVEVPIIPEWAYFLILGLLCLLILFTALSDWEAHPKLFFASWALIVSIAAFLIFASTLKHESDRMRYECTLDDTASFTEIYEKYNVVEQRGEIWVLEDKEE